MSEPTRANASMGFVSTDAIHGRSDAVAGEAARLVAWIVLLTACYVTAPALNHSLFFATTTIGLLWVPSSLLAAALVVTPRRRWWVLFATACVAHVVAMRVDNPVWRMAWQIATQFAFAIGTAEALRRFIGFPVRFERRRDVTVFMGIAVVMASAVAIVSPAVILSVTGYDTFYSPSLSFVRLGLANLTPLLFVTGAVVSGGGLDLTWRVAVSRRRRTEIALIIGVLVVTSLGVLTSSRELTRFPWLMMLTFPPLIWVAVRLGPSAASAALLGVASVSIFGVLGHRGPFVDAPYVVLSLQTFWIVIWAPVMLLAASIREREVVEAALHEQSNQLAHMQRLATVGELSGAIAHELRQPMTSILANAQAGLHYLTRAQVDVEAIREIFEDIVRDDQQAANVIARLRSLMRGASPTFESLAVAPIVRDALALTRSTVASAQTDVLVEVPGSLPPVRGDPVQLLQVLVILVVNACESMVDVPIGDRTLTLRVGRAGTDRLELTVRDRGVGLPPSAEDRVFEPFYTTKSDGLGLGLSIGRSIVSAHGGRLWAETNGDGRGAAFHVELPVATAIDA